MLRIIRSMRDIASESSRQLRSTMALLLVLLLLLCCATTRSAVISSSALETSATAACFTHYNATGGHDLCGCQVDGSPIVLTCGGGGKIQAVVFAAIGTPTGSCGQYVRGSCDGNPATAKAAVTAACVGKSGCSLPTDIGHFNKGVDPCTGVVKHVAVQVTCSTPQKPLPPGPPAPPGPAPPSPPEPPSVGKQGCAVVDVGGTATLSCPGTELVTDISFASYGVIGGSCPAALTHNPLCDADNPKGWGANAAFVVDALCRGKPKCNVPVSAGLFGSEFPCTGGGKKALGVMWACAAAPASPADPVPTLWQGVGYNVMNPLFSEAHNYSYGGKLARDIWLELFAKANASFIRFLDFDQNDKPTTKGSFNFSIEQSLPYLKQFKAQGTEIYWTNFHPAVAPSNCKNQFGPCTPLTPAQVAWAKERASFLAELVGTRGFTNIKWYCFSNELESVGFGTWATYAAAMKQAIKGEPSLAKLGLVGLDDTYSPELWLAAKHDPVDALSLHAHDTGLQNSGVETVFRPR